MSISGSSPVISRCRGCRSISSLVAPIPIPRKSREFFPGVNVIAITAGPPEPISKHELFPLLPEFAEQMALYSVREGVRYDVVHAHYWLSGWVAELARRYWETPFVQMFHTTAYTKMPSREHADRETDLRLQTEKRLLTLADGIIAANPDERGSHLAHGRTD